MDTKVRSNQPLSLITTELRLGIIDSTMEAARAAAGNQDFVLVTAEGQTRGRGTRGRLWESPPGNAYVTLAVNRRHLPAERLSVAPLEMGIILWEEVAARIAETERRRLSLKWPNDLQLDSHKVAGVLMEIHGEFLLVGLGINIRIAPGIEDGGSPTACLAEIGLEDARETLIEGVYRNVIRRFTKLDPWDADQVLLEWQSKARWDIPYRLRDRHAKPWVQPVSLNRQGHLLVRHADGAEEWLVSDYLI